jgi:acetolactate synthase-1/3 small subunit
MRHVLSILLQNESGALARVASMFATRGFNIESLSVAPTEDSTVSRLTLVTSGSDHVINQISKQLSKLVDVVAIADRTGVAHIERELGLLKVRVEPSAAAELNRLVANYGARVLDAHTDHFTFEVTGNELQLNTLLEALPDGVEVLTVVRSGPLVVSRGPESLAERSEL